MKYTACLWLVLVATALEAMERDPFADEPLSVDEPVLGAAVRLGELEFGGRRLLFSRSAGGEIETVDSTVAEPESAASLGRLQLDADDRFDIEFDRVDTRTLLTILAHLVDENLVVAGEITGEVSLNLRDVSFVQVLDLVLFSHALDVHREGNIMLVAPEEALARYREERLQNDRDVESLAPLVTRLIEVEHSEATAVRDLLTGSSGQPRALSERGSVLVDERTNTLILIDADERLRGLTEIVRAIDIPVRQVLIEARVVNVDRSIAEQAGVLWNLLRDDKSRTRATGIAVTSPSGVEVNLLRDRLTLDVELSALASEGLVEIVAQPKVITADQRRATVESGVEIPFQQATSSGATSTAFKEAVLQLEVTPRITPDDWVSLDLEIKQDTIGAVFAGVPSVNTTKIITRVLVEDRQTVVLGGIAQTDRNTSLIKTPLLGDIPGIRHLFRQRIERDDEQDLLVFITPTILDPSNAPSP